MKSPSEQEQRGKKNHDQGLGQVNLYRIYRGGTNIRGTGKEWSVQEGKKKKKTKKQKRVAFSLSLSNFLEIFNGFFL